MMFLAVTWSTVSKCTRPWCLSDETLSRAESHTVSGVTCLPGQDAITHTMSLHFGATGICGVVR